MTARTRGRLYVERHGVLRGGREHQYANGKARPQIAMVAVVNPSDADDPAEEQQANAQHIHDCWNACERFGDNEPEKTLDELAAALRWYANQNKYTGGVMRHPEGGYVILDVPITEDKGQRARDALAMVEEAKR